jgi:hypothetical protein
MQRKPPVSDQEISDGLTESIAQQFITPALEKFLKVLTEANMNTYGVNFPAKIVLRNNAESAQTNAVTASDIAEAKLVKRMSHYFDVLNGHIEDGDYLPGTRSLFGLDIATGNHPVMDTTTKAIAVAGRIASGDAQMVTEGMTQIVDFSAASIAALLVILNDKIGIKNLAKSAHNDALGVVNIMRPLALAALLQVQLEVENNYNHLPLPAMHTYTVLWGLKYETAKEETEIKVICLLPGGILRAAGADLRLGPILTAEGKPSKEGVKGTADAEGEDILKTTQKDTQYINARILGCADAAVPVIIVPGIAQTITVNFVAGTSSL